LDRAAAHPRADAHAGHRVDQRARLRAGNTRHPGVEPGLAPRHGGAMSLSIRQIHPVFVGEVSGVDITRPLAPDEVKAIDAGMDEYAVLVFHDQKLTDEQQMAFTVNFGTLEVARGGNITKDEDRRLKIGMNDVSNIAKDGRLHERDSRTRL